jgi:hypothetical protein
MFQTAVTTDYSGYSDQEDEASGFVGHRKISRPGATRQSNDTVMKPLQRFLGRCSLGEGGNGSTI